MQFTEKKILEGMGKYMIPVPCKGPIIVKGSGSKVQDIQGREYYDFTAGPGVLACGHSHPEIIKVVSDQIGSLTQLPGNLLNVQVVKLAEKLALIAPGELQRSFFCNSGAEAVDAAVKLAKKHASNNCKLGIGIVAVEHAFHGRLALSLSLTGMTGRKKGFGAYAAFPHVHHIMAPYCYRCPLKYPSCELFCAESLERFFQTRMPADGIAAFIVEPLMGVGGVIVPQPEYLKRIRAICDKYGILLIIDEIFTGFGRTGKMFCCEHFGEVPDIMVVAKAIGGGFPLGAILATEKVGLAFEAGDHYTTFGPNNVTAITAGMKAIEIIERDNLINHASQVGNYLMEGLNEFKDEFAFIGDVRGLGLFVGVEIVKDKKSKEPDAIRAKKIREELLERRILTGITGNHSCVLRLTPPLIVTYDEVDIFLRALKETLLHI